MRVRFTAYKVWRLRLGRLVATRRGPLVAGSMGQNEKDNTNTHPGLHASAAPIRPFLVTIPTIHGLVGPSHERGVRHVRSLRGGRILCRRGRVCVILIVGRRGSILVVRRGRCVGRGRGIIRIGARRRRRCDRRGCTRIRGRGVGRRRRI